MNCMHGHFVNQNNFLIQLFLLDMSGIWKNNEERKFSKRRKTNIFR